jgi:hypothetical protein
MMALVLASPLFISTLVTEIYTQVEETYLMEKKAWGWISSGMLERTQKSMRAARDVEGQVVEVAALEAALGMMTIKMQNFVHAVKPAENLTAKDITPRGAEKTGTTPRQ